MSIKLPGIVVTNKANCTPATTKKIPAIQVVNDCNNNCGNGNGDGNGNGGDAEIQESYPYTGYYLRELTYTFDEIGAYEFPFTYWVIVDSNYELVGEDIADQDAFLEALNGMGLGTWTVNDDDVLQVVAYHQYVRLWAANAVNDEQSVITVATDDPVTMLNIYGSTWFDLSLEESIVGNTALMASIAALNFNSLAYPTGAVINWMHYPAVGGDQWGAIEADAVDRGKDWTTAQGGDLYNGGVPYGRYFFEEFQYMIDAVDIPRAVIGINIAFPLIPFSGTTIDWDLVDYQALKDEIDRAVAGVAATNATIYILELGMELITNSFDDLFVNTGGAETTKAQVIKKLLTYTNGALVPALTESIMDHIADVLPDAIISIDGRLWDDDTSHDSDWVSVLTSIPGIHCMRQYYQFKDAEATSYAAVRAKVADRTSFWEFVEDADYNGKKVFLSQLTVKASSPIRNTTANGLLDAEMYMVMSEDNISRNDLLVGMCHMNIKQLFDVNDDYSPKVHYPFFVQMGSYFDDSQEWIPITGNTSLINNNLVMQSILVDGQVRIMILNPTAEDITINRLDVDGVSLALNQFTMVQNYASDSTNPLSTALNSTVSELRFRPYSLTTIFNTPEEVVEVDNMLGMFGSALDNVGLYYSDLYSNATFNTLMATVGFQHGFFSSGSQDRWIHFVSKRGGFDLLPNNEALSTVSPNVGMRANTNEIYHFTGEVDAAVDLHTEYNDSGEDFWARFKAYCAAQDIQMIVFTANMSHGTPTELGQFLTELELLGIPYKVRYGNEMSTGVSDAVTPGATMSGAEYLALVTTFDAYVRSNFPNALRIINATRVGDSGTWDNDDVAALAISLGIEEFSQYFWLNHHGGNEPVANTELNIDDYFTLALQNTIYSVLPGNYSLYGEVLPRLLDYYNRFYPVRMQVAQYGCNLQRTGYVANTMFHGIAIANQLFEFWKFNYTHNNFISSATFLMNESAVDEQTSQDLLFTVDSAWKMTSGGRTFIKRIQGVVYELFKPLSTYAAGYPEFIPVTITNKPVKFDAACFAVNGEVYIWMYNYDAATEIQSIVPDGDAPVSTVNKTGAYSTKLYGSIGTSPAYGYFKDFTTENPGFVPVNILRINNTSISAVNLDVEQCSVIKLKLNGVTSASGITINITPTP